jgi:PadR family transcriptional regulator PadR
MAEPRLTLPTLRVLDCILSAQGKELSGAEVARATGLASGTMYPILLRLERAGWLRSRWEEVDPQQLGRPRRRLYQVTGIGRAQATAAFLQINVGQPSWA